MAKKIIGWTPFVGGNCTGLDFLLDKPESVFSKYIKNTDYRYRYCPSTLELTRNTFVIVSPCDLHFVINANTQQIELIPPTVAPADFFYVRSGQYGDGDTPLMSLNMHQLFLTEEKNIEITITAPWFQPNASSQFIISPGRVDISKWWRPIDCAFQLLQKVQEVNIRKGEPLFYINVRTGDPSDVVVIKQIKVTPELEAYIKKCTDLKHFQRQCPLKTLYSMASNRIASRPKLEFLE